MEGMQKQFKEVRFLSVWNLENLIPVLAKARSLDFALVIKKKGLFWKLFLAPLGSHISENRISTDT